MVTDLIDELRSGWNAELPDLDIEPMVTVALVNRAAGLLRRHVEAGLEASSTTMGEFDVLSALRRQGAPYQLKPSELARTVMLSPSGMTHRIDQLEMAGLVERVVDPDSRRTVPVALTDAGVAAAEGAVRALVATEREALDGLTAAEQKQLDSLLAKVIATVDR